jgi:hypothetical protein
MDGRRPPSKASAIGYRTELDRFDLGVNVASGPPLLVGIPPSPAVVRRHSRRGTSCLLLPAGLHSHDDDEDRDSGSADPHAPLEHLTAAFTVGQPFSVASPHAADRTRLLSTRCGWVVPKRKPGDRSPTGHASGRRQARQRCVAPDLMNGDDVAVEDLCTGTVKAPRVGTPAMVHPIVTSGRTDAANPRG